MDMMASSSSPFSKTEGGYSPSNLSDYYSISAEIDLTNLFDYDYLNEWPESERIYIYSKLDDFKGTVTFDFLGNSLEHTSSLSGTANKAQLSLGGITEISSVVEVPNKDNRQRYDELKNEKTELESQKKLYTLFVIIAGSVLAVLIILATVLLILRNKKSRKNDEAPNNEASARKDSHEEDK